MTFLTTLVAFVIALGVLIVFHEFGHYLVARWCGVKVLRFSVGYSSKTVLQRMAIISAGVIMNVLTGYLFFVFGYWSGIQEPSPVVGAVRSGFPAWEAGIRAGDRITEVNGDRIRSFIDLQEAILLSSGDISLRLLRADGTDTTVNVTPMKSSPGRSIGVAPTVTTELVRNIPDPALISDADMPLDRASESFLPADRVVAVRPASTQEPIPVSLLPELRSLLGRYADQELTYIVERPSPDPAQPTAFQTVEIKVPAQNVRSTGFWMAMGPIRAIQKDSVAARAGLKVGDTIRSVDGKTPGEDIDNCHAESVRWTARIPERTFRRSETPLSTEYAR